MAKSALVLVVLLVLAPPALGERLKAELDCKFTGTDFVYDCLIRFDPPREGLRISVGADMPSMPMAHNVKPVKAKPTATPGEYRASLDLEMTGEWAVKLRLSGPVRDLLVLHYEFDERGARAARRGASRSSPESRRPPAGPRQ